MYVCVCFTCMKFTSDICNRAHPSLWYLSRERVCPHIGSFQAKLTKHRDKVDPTSKRRYYDIAVTSKRRVFSGRGHGLSINILKRAEQPVYGA